MIVMEVPTYIALPSRQDDISVQAFFLRSSIKEI